jgi:hypothetical protein
MMVARWIEDIGEKHHCRVVPLSDSSLNESEPRCSSP